MDYLSFYKLDQEPFSNTPVSRFYFNSDQHSRALTRLDRVAKQMKGFALLLGDIGAGKTTLARKLLDSLPDHEFESALLVIIHSGITADWLLRRIAQQLGVQSPAKEKLQLLSQLYQRLLQIADSGKKAVVLIDEAQMFKTKEIMEEFRGLLNLELPDRKLITFIFFGLPELEDHLKLDPPLMQRVALKCHLDALDRKSCSEYIDHRLKLVGGERKILDVGAIDAIYRYSRGIPRLINTLADNALFEGFMVKAPTITTEIVENIAVDLGLSLVQKKAYRIDEEPKEEVVKESQVELDSIELDAIDNLEPEEKTDQHPFERKDADDSDDIDSILSGLEDKG